MSGPCTDKQFFHSGETRTAVQRCENGKMTFGVTHHLRKIITFFIYLFIYFFASCPHKDAGLNAEDVRHTRERWSKNVETTLSFLTLAGACPSCPPVGWQK